MSSDHDNLLLVQHFFPELVHVYQQFRHTILRVDFIRYLLMYVWGGVYADLDLECLQSMQSLLDGDDQVVSGGGGDGDRSMFPNDSSPPSPPRIVLGRESAIRNTVDISFLASVPGEIFWLKVARVAVASDGLERIHDVLQVTGNRMFTRVLEQELLAGMSGVVVHDVPVLYAPAMGLVTRRKSSGGDGGGDGDGDGEGEGKGKGEGEGEAGMMELAEAKGYVPYFKDPEACRCGVVAVADVVADVAKKRESSCRKCRDLFPSSRFVHHETGTWVKTFWKVPGEAVQRD